LVRGDFPFFSLFAIRVENEKVQKVVNNNYIATVQGEIRAYSRQAMKMKQIIDRLPKVPILTGNAWESITRGQAEILTKLQVLSRSGASFRVADNLAIGSALADEGLAIGRKEVSKFFEGVPEHAAAICRDWINQHQGQCAFSMSWDCYTALGKGLTYMVGKLSGLAIDGDRFGVVFLLEEIPRVSATAPVKGETVLRAIADYIPEGATGAAGMMEVVCFGTDGDPSEVKAARGMATALKKWGIAVAGSTDDDRVVTMERLGRICSSGEAQRGHAMGEASTLLDDELPPPEQFARPVTMDALDLSRFRILVPTNAEGSLDPGHVYALMATHGLARVSVLSTAEVREKVALFRRTAPPIGGSQVPDEGKLKVLAKALSGSAAEDTEDDDELNESARALARRFRDMMESATVAYDVPTLARMTDLVPRGVWGYRVQTGRLLRKRFPDVKRFQPPFAGHTRDHWEGLLRMAAFMEEVIPLVG
jgi:hypothetical protein